MELFYGRDISGGIVNLDAEESAHCVRVLRHRRGERISVIDGAGTLLECELLDDDPRACSARIISETPGFGSHPYRLTLAVCPTKNIDRYEWFAEKATEIGVDVIVPVIGDHSERKVLKTDRLRKILVSAAKQSLKGAVPQMEEPVSVKEFIAAAPEDALRMIAYCFEEESARVSIKKVLDAYAGREIVVLIGPEGDFSREEVRAALDSGFVPVHLGDSRLRTETAAVTAAEAAYFKFL